MGCKMVLYFSKKKYYRFSQKVLSFSVKSTIILFEKYYRF